MAKKQTAWVCLKAFLFVLETPMHLEYGLKTPELEKEPPLYLKNTTINS
jgi:hypothetical protein